MAMTLKKVYADLRSSPGRALLVIVALAVGIWGVGGILVSYVVLTRDLNANFTQTRPPHAILTSEDFQHLDFAALRARPEIESAEFRDLSLQRIEVHPDDWIPLWLFGVEDFYGPQLAQTYPVEGARIPPPGTMLIEREARLISDLNVGSLAKIRVGPRVSNVRVSGINFDPAQAPATQDHFIYAYVDKPTYTSITGEAANRRLILRVRNVSTTKDVQLAVDKLLDDLKARGIYARTVKIPELNEHPHQWQLDTLLLLQGGIGLLAFLMGAVLVSQLMASVLARQVRQIGILKAIGATRRRIIAIYVSMTLVLGIVAGVIAVPLAVWSGFAFSYFVASKINFEILTQHLPLNVYVLLVVLSLALPVGLSWSAIRRGANVSVHDAITDYGISVDAGDVASVSKVSSRLPSGWMLAVRNTLRRKRRLAITVTAMALGVAIFSTGFNVRESLSMLLADVRTNMKHDVQVVLNDSVDREHAMAVFSGIGNVKRIETWNGGRGELQTQVISTSGGIGIVALPHDTGLFRPRVVAGRWLSISDPPEVVMNQQAAELYGDPSLGSRESLQIGDTTLTVKLVGIVQELDKPKIYMAQSQYDAAANPQHRINSLIFVATENRYEQVMVLKRDIEAAIAASDLNVLYVMSQAERVKVIYDHLDIVLTTIVLLSLSVLVVSALGMASATGINILERTREIGVLRAIGATPRTIFRLFVAEGMLVSAASIVLGLLMAWPLSRVAAVFFGALMLADGAALRYAFSIEGFLITLAVTVAFGWLASRVPARRAIRVATRDALAYE